MTANICLKERTKKKERKRDIHDKANHLYRYKKINMYINMYNINTIIHCRLCAVRKSYCYYCYYWIDLLQLILKVIYRCVWTQFLGLLTFLLICLLYYSWLQSFAICNFYICLRLVDLGSFLQLYFFVDQKSLAQLDYVHSPYYE